MKKAILILIICVLCSTQVHSQWALTGNSGTNASTNFIGTTDAKAFKIRTNNGTRITVTSGGKVGIGITSPAFKLDVKGGSINTDSAYRLSGNTVLWSKGTGNFFVGPYSATFINPSLGGVNNTTLGINTLYSNTWGQDNTAVGTNALYSTDGAHNNTAVGAGAMYANTSGTLNTACGAYAMNAANGYQNAALGAKALYNCIGGGNTASGYEALYSNTSGSDNTASGFQALYANTTARNNVAIGRSALSLQSFDPGVNWPSNNVAVGYYALHSNQPTATSNGVSNTAVGTNAMYTNATGGWNTAIGSAALYFNTEGDLNTAIGASALYYNTTGEDNTAIGHSALSDNNTGNYNTALGLGALSYSKAGNFGTALGTFAMYNSNSTTTPFTNYNVAVGYYALRGSFPPAQNTGNYNSALGSQTLYNNSSGSENTAIGMNAMYDNTTGASNTAVGLSSLYYNTTAVRNSALGRNAGSTHINGSFNTFAGAYSGSSAQGFSNSSTLGDAALITASNQVRLGDGGVTSIGGYANWTNISDGRFKNNIQENVPGIEFISKLRPVTYTLDVHGVNQYINVKDTVKENIYHEKSRIRYTGFIAQEVESAAKELGFDFSGVDAPKNEKDIYGLRYAEFVVPLVKAVQELNLKMNEFDDLKMENEMIKSILSDEQQQKLKTLLEGKSPANWQGDLEGPSPNPFNTQTEIKFRLPSTFGSAQLIITDVNGSQVRNVPIQPGLRSSSIIITASELAAGTYSYSLVIDGANVDTKQMVLTK